MHTDGTAPSAMRAATGLHFLDASMFWGSAGGVRRVLTTKHELLAAQGWRHTLMAPGIAGPGTIDCGGLELPRSGGYRMVLDRKRAERQIEQAQPDIVEAADPFMLAGATLRATARLGIPAVAFCHSNLPTIAARLVGGADGTATWRGRWVARLARTYLLDLYRRFDLVLAPSRCLADLLREGGLSNVMHQPLGVDCSIFRPTASDLAWRDRFCQRLGLSSATRLLVYTGRFAPEKNLPLITQALTLLGPGHVLLTVGSGPCIPRGPRVVVLPPEHDRRRLARLLASCDAYVHAGDQETFGLGVLEAMACGTPVVVSAAAGLGELAHEAGTLVAGRRVQDWADAISATLNGGASTCTYKALARARQHDWYWILEQMSCRYLKLLQGRVHPPRLP